MFYYPGIKAESRRLSEGVSHGRLPHGWYLPLFASHVAQTFKPGSGTEVWDLIQSVTAPLLAVDTKRANFANAPRVYRGLGCFHFFLRAASSLAGTLS